MKKEPESFKETMETDKIRCKNMRRDAWLIDLDKYCTRHGISRCQFASIFCESERNFDSWRSLFWPSGETMDWMEEINSQKGFPYEKRN